MPHHLQPAVRHAVGGPVVEQRRDRLGEQLIEGGGLKLVPPGRVRHAVGGRDLPPVAAVVPLVPPAVPDGQVEAAVQCDLHAGGTGGLQGPQRVVQPDVAACHQERGERHVVVGQEHDPAADRLGVGEPHHLLDQPLAALVRRMRLARDHDLDGPLRVEQQRGQPLRVVQHQRQALVRRHPAGEPDREDVRVEHVIDPGQLGTGRAALPPGLAQPAAGLGHEPGAQHVADRPQVAGVGVRGGHRRAPGPATSRATQVGA